MSPLFVSSGESTTVSARRGAACWPFFETTDCLPPAAPLRVRTVSYHTAMDPAAATTFAIFVEQAVASPERGTILAGQLVHGTVRVGSSGFLIRETGVSSPVQITHIDRLREALSEAGAGLHVRLEVRGIQEDDVRPGNILQSSSSERLFDPDAPQCTAISCRCPRERSDGLFCKYHHGRDLLGEVFPLKANDDCTRPQLDDILQWSDGHTGTMREWDRRSNATTPSAPALNKPTVESKNSKWSGIPTPNKPTVESNSKWTGILFTVLSGVGALACFSFMIWWFNPTDSHTEADFALCRPCRSGFFPGRGVLQGIPFALGVACGKRFLQGIGMR
jgi:hypothetical protein